MYDRSSCVKEYGVDFNPSFSTPSVEQMVELGLRRNKKRAHLLVSRVLGKHIPQDPRIIAYSAHLLAAKVGEVLNPELDNSEGINASSVALGAFLDGKMDVEEMPRVPPYASPDDMPSAVVIGFAETATGLGFDVAEHLNEWYVHSTRNFAGRHRFLAFEEEHSHATSHALVPDVNSPLENPLLPAVLVDDEFSTGKTAMNIIKEMHKLIKRDLYIIAALVDCRSEDNRQKMDEFAAELGVEVRVVALSSGEVTLPEGLVERVWQDAENAPSGLVQSSSSGPVKTYFIVVDDSMGAEHSRFGLHPKEYLQSLPESVAYQVSPALVPGKTLVLGQEEFMHFPMLVGECLSILRDDVRSSTTTRSPILVLDRPDYPVDNGISFLNGRGEERFAYNVGGFDNIVIPMEPGQDPDELFIQHGLVETLSEVTGNIVVVSTTRNEAE